MGSGLLCFCLEKTSYAKISMTRELISFAVSTTFKFASAIRCDSFSATISALKSIRSSPLLISPVAGSLIAGSLLAGPFAA